jgi:hypothetical protein
MGEGFPEYILNNSTADFYSNWSQIPNTLVFDGSDVYAYTCYSKEPTIITKFYGLPSETKCLRIEMVDKNTFSVKYSLSEVDDEYILKGTIILENTHSSLGYETAVKLWISEKQKVFPTIVNSGYQIGSLVSHQERKGIFKSVDGLVVRQVGIKLSPTYKRRGISGILDGKLILNLFSGF